MSEKLEVREREIPGFYEIDIPLHGDERGWFKENYQKAKLEALGLPAFEAVQNNDSFNKQKGVVRGLHAEPWEKYISLTKGKVFGAWVDLRAGDSFGRVLTMELTPAKAVFVPRGVANGYQTLEENTAYAYLVNEHWSPDTQYVGVDPFDPALNIDWPIPKDQAIISEKDGKNPPLKDIKPMEF